MSVQKSFRFSDLSNAMLEQLAKREGRTQTDIIEQLIEAYVIYDLDPAESSELIKAAKARIGDLRAKE